MKISLLMGTMLLSIVAATCGVTQAAELEGQRFDDSVRIGGRDLVLNGLGLRGVLFIKGYVAGLYVQQKSSDASSLLAEKGPKRLDIRMLRDAEAKVFIDAFIHGLEKNHSESELAGFRPRMDLLEQVMNAIGAVRKGDLVGLEFTPELGTRISLNGTPKGSAIAGGDFYSAILRIFVGDNPVDKGLKKGLLGG